MSGIDWAGAAERHRELTDLKNHLLRVGVPGTWRVVAEIDRQLAGIPHPGWLKAAAA